MHAKYQTAVTPAQSVVERGKKKKREMGIKNKSYFKAYNTTSVQILKTLLPYRRCISVILSSCVHKYMHRHMFF